MNLLVIFLLIIFTICYILFDHFQDTSEDVNVKIIKPNPEAFLDYHILKFCKNFYKRIKKDNRHIIYIKGY